MFINDILFEGVLFLSYSLIQQCIIFISWHVSSTSMKRMKPHLKRMHHIFRIRLNFWEYDRIFNFSMSEYYGIFRIPSFFQNTIVFSRIRSFFKNTMHVGNVMSLLLYWGGGWRSLRRPRLLKVGQLKRTFYFENYLRSLRLPLPGGGCYGLGTPWMVQLDQDSKSIWKSYIPSNYLLHIKSDLWAKKSPNT